MSELEKEVKSEESDYFYRVTEFPRCYVDFKGSNLLYLRAKALEYYNNMLSNELKTSDIFYHVELIEGDDIDINPIAESRYKTKEETEKYLSGELEYEAEIFRKLGITLN